MLPQFATDGNASSAWLMIVVEGDVLIGTALPLVNARPGPLPRAAPAARVRHRESGDFSSKNQAIRTILGGMKQLIVLMQILFCTVLVSSASALTVPERLVYDVSWGGMKAGSAVLEVAEHGEDLRLVNTIRTSGLFSAMFTVDDKSESVISRGPARSGQPKFFSENVKEGKYRARKEARFDYEKLTAESKDFLKKSEKTDRISDRTYDSLSSIYFIRSSDLTRGESISFDIYDFKRLWNTEVRVVKREVVRTPLGTFNTLVVTSQLTFNGVPAKVGNATFWLTDDSRHVPVRIKSKLKVGEMTLTLVGGTYRS